MEKEENYGETEVKAKSGWLDTHKAARRLICFGIFLLFLAMLFVALRSYGIYRMDHYAEYAVNQTYFGTGGGTGSTASGFDARVSYVVVDNAPDIEGCEQFVTLQSPIDQQNSVLNAYYARFETKDSALGYLNGQSADTSRNRYVLGNYYFDFPREKSTAGAEGDALSAINNYNDAVYNLNTSDLLLTIILYRAFVVFDFTTGIDNGPVQEA